MSLLTAIRARTTPQHQELETVLDIPKQVRTREQYAALLARFAALYRPWEARLLTFEEDFRRAGIMLSERLRVPNLERDLAGLDANLRLCGAEA